MYAMLSPVSGWMCLNTKIVGIGKPESQNQAGKLLCLTSWPLRSVLGEVAILHSFLPGKVYWIASLPLEHFLDTHGISNKSMILTHSTAFIFSSSASSSPLVQFLLLFARFCFVLFWSSSRSYMNAFHISYFQLEEVVSSSVVNVCFPASKGNNSNSTLCGDGPSLTPAVTYRCLKVTHEWET